jgi:signal transduction histidine kinase
VRKDGSRLTVALTLSPMHGDQGEVVGFVGVATDITARKAMDRMKDEFISIVSHELRTPLTGIRGSLGLLAGGVLGPVSPQAQRMLDIAVSNTDRLIRLVSDMLDLERMQSNRAELQKVRCDLGDLLQQATDVMRPQAERAGVGLDVDPLAVSVQVDPDRVVQVLTNLLSNAIKFSSAGTRVCVSAEPVGGGRVRVDVRDQGRGIPAEQLEHIFERFRQVDASDSRAKGGSGLGLAICRMIVEQHGGRIWAQSTPGQGSTLSFELPTAATPSA